jgi:upstream activation factor subunit UAF30
MSSTSKHTKKSDGVEVQLKEKKVVAPKEKKETATKENKEVAPKKEKKEKKTAVVDAVPVSTDAVDAPVSTDAAPKKEKKTRVAKKETTEVTPSVQDAAVPSASDEVVLQESSVFDDFSALSAKVAHLGSLVSAIKSEIRSVEKKFIKELKVAQKSSSRRKTKTGAVRNPSGFVKPTLISDELASFLGKEKGTEMARTAVTREINQYIRSNNLQDSANGRKINADDKLISLLKLTPDEVLTYFNLQKFMSPHFQKNIPASLQSSV